MSSISRPRVLITGAGSGLGEAMARKFVSEGFQVAICDLDKERADRVLASLVDQAPGSFSHQMDVRHSQDWDALHERVSNEWGSLNVLVNNAGVAAAGNCEDSPLEDWRWVIDVDLMGVVNGCHRFIPMLRRTASEQSEPCHLVNIASFAGIAAMPGLSAYGTAKAAVVALSEQLRAELFDAGVGVSVVCPAFVKTRLLETFRTPDQSDHSRIEKWMENSGVSSEDVATQTFEAMKKGKFLVLTHRITRQAWRMKRFMPERYFHGMRKAMQKPEAKFENQGSS